MDAPAEPNVVEFFFSPGSRYSYLAASQAPVIEADTGCRVEWRPVNGPDSIPLREPPSHAFWGNDRIAVLKHWLAKQRDGREACKR